MNNRRSFFKSLSLIGSAAIGCPGIFIPKFEPIRWKRIVDPRSIPNPDWINAEFTTMLNDRVAVFDEKILEASHSGVWRWEYVSDSMTTLYL